MWQQLASTARPWRRRMVGRDREETGRSSTPLELLFDLCFVVAVSSAADQLHHFVVDGHVGDGLVGYLMIFFAIWWAWMNFTWFASAYDTDDVRYRLLTFVQIAGVLVIAAGVPAATDRQDFSAVTIGYVLLRLSMVVQWLSVAGDDPMHRFVARRYAVGVATVQVGWLLRLLLPDGLGLIGFVVLAVAEMVVPILAERGSMTNWHREHIAERYGLFTLIVLGEAVLGSVNAVQGAIADHGVSGQVLLLACGGLVLFFSCWWTYFDRPFAELLAPDTRSVFGWGYAHYFLFASLAGLGAGLEVALAYFEEHEHMSARTAGFAVTIPVAVFLVVLGVICSGLTHRPVLAVVAAAQTVVILAVTWWVAPLDLGVAVVTAGLVVAAGAIASVVAANRVGGAGHTDADATMAAL
jgi:low temperature requirement protein LtrA